MEENSPIIINNDNDMLHEWYLNNKNHKNIITYGIENKSDFMAEDIYTDSEGSKFTVKINDKKYNVQINIGGKHFISNSLCAICVGIQNNIEIEKIIEGIKEFELTKRRMEARKGINSSTIINDSYNASYDSMKAAIEYLSDIQGGRKIAVLGDMLELGKFEKELHEKVGEEVYKNKIDILVTVGNASKYIANKAENLGMEKTKIFVYDTKEEAIEMLKSIIKKDDYILVKASNNMKFDEIVKSLEL